MTEEEAQIIYDYLHQTYVYENGLLKNKKRNKIIDGHLEKNSKTLNFRMTIRVKNKKYKWSISHIIYFYHKKIKPKYIKYINGNKCDTRIENLACMNHQEMMNNCDLFVKNKNKFKGVIKDGNRFAARIWINKKYKYCGWFNTPEEAYQAYLKAKNENT